MFRCFGASVARTLALFVVQFIVLGIAQQRAWRRRRAASASNCSRRCCAAAFVETLPLPTMLPALKAFATGVLLLFGFALPPLVALANVPPLRVLRRDLPRPRAGGNRLRMCCGAAVVARADRLAGAGGAGGDDHARRRRPDCWSPPAALAWLLLTLLKRVPQRGVTWRFGLANLRRRAARVEPADRRAGARADGAPAADRRARRPAAQLAREPAAGCAQPVPRQRAARPGRRRARVARRRRSASSRNSSRWCAAGSSR